MKTSRIEMLYQQKLVTAENARKTLPLEHILQKDLEFYPQMPTNWDFTTLEIGPGRGDFLLQMAQNSPNDRFIAIEIGNKRFQKIKENIKNLALKNITLVKGDARTLLGHTNYQKFNFHKVFVLFPDPWPRNKQRHKRLLQKDFLKDIFAKLQTTGEFTLATDVKDYALWVSQNLKDINNIQNTLSPDTYKETLPDSFPTFFEQKWKSMGRDTFYLRYKKI